MKIAFKIISIILIGAFLLQDIAWANPEIVSGNQSAYNLQIPSLFQGLRNIRAEKADDIVRANLEYIIRSYPDIRNFVFPINYTNLDGAEIDLDFPNREIKDGAATVRCTVAFNGKKELYNAVIDTNDRSLKLNRFGCSGEERPTAHLSQVPEQRITKNSRKSIKVDLVSFTASRHPQRSITTALYALSGNLKAALIRSRVKYDVKIHDMYADHDLTIKSVAKEIRERRPQVLALSLALGTLENAKALFNEIEALPADDRPIIVMGGALLAHYRDMQKLNSAFPKAIVVMGEGEVALGEIAKIVAEKGKAAYEQANRYPGAIYFTERGNQLGSDELKKADPANIYMPPIAELARADVKELIKIAKKGAKPYLEASRGCPWGRCKYCVPNANGFKSFRKRPLEHIFYEVRELASAGIYSFDFADEEFIGISGANLDRVIELAKGIQKISTELGLERSGKKLNFTISCRANSIFNRKDSKDSGLRRKRIEALKELQKAGLKKIFLGAESGSKAQLDRYNKDLTLKETKLAIRIIRHLKIDLEVGFIMFDPKVELKEIIENIRFLEKTDLFNDVSWFLNELRLQAGSKLEDEYTGAEDIYMAESPDESSKSYKHTYIDSDVESLVETMKEAFDDMHTTFYHLKSIMRSGTADATEEDKRAYPIYRKYRDELIKQFRSSFDEMIRIAIDSKDGKFKEGERDLANNKAIIKARLALIRTLSGMMKEIKQCDLHKLQASKQMRHHVNNYIGTACRKIAANVINRRGTGVGQNTKVDIIKVPPAEPMTDYEGYEEIVCWIKPEGTFSEYVMGRILKQILRTGYSLEGISISSGSRVELKQIFERLHPLAFRVAREGAKLFNKDDKDRLRKIYREDPDKMKMVPAYDLEKLLGKKGVIDLWEAQYDKDNYFNDTNAVGIKRLDKGKYVARVSHKDIDGGKPFLLINGVCFQLRAIEQKENTVALFLRGRRGNVIGQREFRENVIGHAIPRDCKDTSVRKRYINRELVREPTFYYKIIGMGYGPLETLSASKIWFDDMSYSNTAFGKMLMAEGYTKEEIDALIKEPLIDMDGKTKDLSSWVEEMGPVEAKGFLKKVLPSSGGASPDMAARSVLHMERNDALRREIRAGNVFRVNKDGVTPEIYKKEIVRGPADSKISIFQSAIIKISTLSAIRNIRNTVHERLKRIRGPGGALWHAADTFKLQPGLLIAANSSPNEFRARLYRTAQEVDILIAKDRFTLHENGPIAHTKRGVSANDRAIWLGEKLFTCENITDEDIASLILEEAKHILIPDADHATIAHSENLKNRLTKIAFNLGEEPARTFCEADMSEDNKIPQADTKTPRLIRSEDEEYFGVKLDLEDMGRRKIFITVDDMLVLRGAGDPEPEAALVRKAHTEKSFKALLTENGLGGLIDLSVTGVIRGIPGKDPFISTTFSLAKSAELSQRSPAYSGFIYIIKIPKGTKVIFDFEGAEFTVLVPLKIPKEWVLGILRTKNVYTYKSASKIINQKIQQAIIQTLKGTKDALNETDFDRHGTYFLREWARKLLPEKYGKNLTEESNETYRDKPDGIYLPLPGLSDADMATGSSILKKDTIVKIRAAYENLNSGAASEALIGDVSCLADVNHGDLKEIFPTPDGGRITKRKAIGTGYGLAALDLRIEKGEAGEIVLVFDYKKIGGETGVSRLAWKQDKFLTAAEVAIAKIKTAYAAIDSGATEVEIGDISCLVNMKFGVFSSKFPLPDGATTGKDRWIGAGKDLVLLNLKIGIDGSGRKALIFDYERKNGKKGTLRSVWNDGKLIIDKQTRMTPKKASKSKGQPKEPRIPKKIRDILEAPDDYIVMEKPISRKHLSIPSIKYSFDNAFMRLCLEEFISGLKPRDRQVIDLYIKGFSCVSIGKIFNFTGAWAQATVKRIQEELKDMAEGKLNRVGKYKAEREASDKIKRLIDSLKATVVAARVDHIISALKDIERSAEEKALSLKIVNMAKDAIERAETQRSSIIEAYEKAASARNAFRQLYLSVPAVRLGAYDWRIVNHYLMGFDHKQIGTMLKITAKEVISALNSIEIDLLDMREGKPGRLEKHEMEKAAKAKIEKLLKSLRKTRKINELDAIIKALEEVRSSAEAKGLSGDISDMVKDAVKTAEMRKSNMHDASSSLTQEGWKMRISIGKLSDILERRGEHELEIMDAVRKLIKLADGIVRKTRDDQPDEDSLKKIYSALMQAHISYARLRGSIINELCKLPREATIYKFHPKMQKQMDEAIAARRNRPTHLLSVNPFILMALPPIVTEFFGALEWQNAPILAGLATIALIFAYVIIKKIRHKTRVHSISQSVKGPEPVQPDRIQPEKPRTIAIEVHNRNAYGAMLSKVKDAGIAFDKGIILAYPAAMHGNEVEYLPQGIVKVHSDTGNMDLRRNIDSKADHDIMEKLFAGGVPQDIILSGEFYNGCIVEAFKDILEYLPKHEGDVNIHFVGSITNMAITGGTESANAKFSELKDDGKWKSQLYYMLSKDRYSTAVYIDGERVTPYFGDEKPRISLYYWTSLNGKGPADINDILVRRRIVDAIAEYYDNGQRRGTITYAADVPESDGIFLSSSTRIVLDVAKAFLTGKENVLDLGSGNGETVFKFSQFAKHVTGIELSPSLYEESKTCRLHLGKQIDLENTELMNKDFFDEDFSKYDVIYIFWPNYGNMKNFKVKARLEEKLLKEMKPGAVFVINEVGNIGRFTKLDEVKLPDSISDYLSVYKRPLETHQSLGAAIINDENNMPKSGQEMLESIGIMKLPQIQVQKTYVDQAIFTVAIDYLKGLKQDLQVEAESSGVSTIQAGLHNTKQEIIDYGNRASEIANTSLADINGDVLIDRVRNIILAIELLRSFKVPDGNDKHYIEYFGNVIQHLAVAESGAKTLGGHLAGKIDGIRQEVLRSQEFLDKKEEIELLEGAKERGSKDGLVYLERMSHIDATLKLIYQMAGDEEYVKGARGIFVCNQDPVVKKSGIGYYMDPDSGNVYLSRPPTKGRTLALQLLSAFSFRQLLIDEYIKEIEKQLPAERIGYGNPANDTLGKQKHKEMMDALFAEEQRFKREKCLGKSEGLFSKWLYKIIDRPGFATALLEKRKGITSWVAQLILNQGGSMKELGMRPKKSFTLTGSERRALERQARNEGTLVSIEGVEAKTMFVDFEKTFGPRAKKMGAFHIDSENDDHIIAINKALPDNVVQEAIYHETREIYWMTHRNMRKRFSPHQAHTIAWAEGIKKFSNNYTELTPYQKWQVEELLDKSELEALIREDDEMRAWHKRALRLFQYSQREVKVDLDAISNHEKMFRDKVKDKLDRMAGIPHDDFKAKISELVNILKNLFTGMKLGCISANGTLGKVLEKIVTKDSIRLVCKMDGVSEHWFLLIKNRYVVDIMPTADVKAKLGDDAIVVEELERAKNISPWYAIDPDTIDIDPYVYIAAEALRNRTYEDLVSARPELARYISTLRRAWDNEPAPSASSAEDLLLQDLLRRFLATPAGTADIIPDAAKNIGQDSGEIYILPAISQAVDESGHKIQAVAAEQKARAVAEGYLADRTLPGGVFGDIGRAVYELATNCIKRGDGGVVKIEAKKTTDDVLLRIVARDLGKGIEDMERERAKSFSESTASDKRGHGFRALTAEWSPFTKGSIVYQTKGKTWTYDPVQNKFMQTGESAVNKGTYITLEVTKKQLLAKTQPIGGGMNAEQVKQFARTGTPAQLVTYLMTSGLLKMQGDMIRKELSSNQAKLAEFERLIAVQGSGAATSAKDKLLLCQAKMLELARNSNPQWHDLAEEGLKLLAQLRYADLDFPKTVHGFVAIFEEADASYEPIEEFLTKDEPSYAELEKYDSMKEMLPQYQLIASFRELTDSGFFGGALKAWAEIKDKSGPDNMVYNKALDGYFAAREQLKQPETIKKTGRFDLYLKTLADSIVREDKDGEAKAIAYFRERIYKSKRQAKTILHDTMKLLDLNDASATGAFKNIAAMRILAEFPDEYKTLALTKKLVDILGYKGYYSEAVMAAGKSFFESIPDALTYKPMDPEIKKTMPVSNNSVGEYIKEVMGYPMLTDLGDLRLTMLMNLGDIAARQRLIQANYRAPLSIAKKYSRLGVDFMGMVNAGNEGLLKATEKYDPRRGAKFITYATWWIKNRIFEYIDQEKNIVRLPRNTFITFIKGCEKAGLDPADMSIPSGEIARAIDMSIGTVNAVRERIGATTISLDLQDKAGGKNSDSRSMDLVETQDKDLEALIGETERKAFETVQKEEDAATAEENMDAATKAVMLSSGHTDLANIKRNMTNFAGSSNKLWLDSAIRGLGILINMRSIDPAFADTLSDFKGSFDKAKSAYQPSRDPTYKHLGKTGQIDNISIARELTRHSKYLREVDDAMKALDELIDGSQNTKAAADTYLRDIRDPKELTRNMIGAMISVQLSGKRLVLAFHKDVSGARAKKLLPILRKLEALKDKEGFDKLLKNMVIVPSYSSREDLAEQLERRNVDPDDKAHNAIFAFAPESQKYMVQGQTIMTVLIADKGFDPTFHYYPLFEIITMSLAKYLKNYSVKEIKDVIKTMQIDQAQINIKDISASDSAFLIISLAPSSERYDPREMEERYRRISEYISTKA
jgi:RNA polymerase sigma factor (sigma-70 family)